MHAAGPGKRSLSFLFSRQQSYKGNLLAGPYQENVWNGCFEIEFNSICKLQHKLPHTSERSVVIARSQRDPGTRATKGAALIRRRIPSSRHMADSQPDPHQLCLVHL
eukprot:1140610-Pelagomonas_calceolata.AAC.1